VHHGNHDNNDTHLSGSPKDLDSLLGTRIKRLIELFILEYNAKLTWMVAQACNSSSSGGRDQEEHFARAKVHNIPFQSVAGHGGSHL
jgi:hypothetical protein